MDALKLLVKTNTIKDILGNTKGVVVDILLKNGKMYQGIVETIGKFNIHLKLTGERSFFDAIIQIDEICAVEFQVRGRKT